jgi:predicted Zn-dependent protease
MAAVAQKGALVQRRTNNGWSTHSYQTGLELFTSEALRERAVTIGSQALELLEADECPAETMSLVLAPDQMYIQIHESIGHPLELDRILGDERNYAGSSFVKLSDFGSLVYGSPLMNIVFDPTQAGQFSCYAFDDIGNTAKRESLIENGILKRGLGSLESQIRSGVKGVANQRASQWNRAPIDRIANINMQPGQSPRDEVIGSVERGIYMESNRSWSIDDYRHKFQFGCEYGKLIEDGRLTRTVRNPAYRSTTPHFWRNLSRVGNAQTFEVYGAPHCGKGEPNQMIRHGHAAPLCRFDHIEVFGGGQ